MNFKIAFSIGLAAILQTDVTFAAKTSADAATATFKAAPGQKIKGDIQFKNASEGIEVSATVQGLKPGAVHAIHVHENGKCEEPSFESAGSHFNPTKEPHAHLAAKQHHIGDLGNIVADKNGVGKLELVMARAKFSDETSPLNKAVVLHAQPDDLRSQPSGEAGARIACGIITTK